jgi:hypothetical protein
MIALLFVRLSESLSVHGYSCINDISESYRPCSHSCHDDSHVQSARLPAGVASDDSALNARESSRGRDLRAGPGVLVRN